MVFFILWGRMSGKGEAQSRRAFVFYERTKSLEVQEEIGAQCFFEETNTLRFN